MRGFHQKVSNSVNYLQNISFISRHICDTHHWYQCITHSHLITVAGVKEVYTYMGSVCETFESIRREAVWSSLLQYVSSTTCEAICTTIAARNCASIIYHRGNKSCLIFSHVVTNTYASNHTENCKQFEYYTRYMKVKSIGKRCCYLYF